MSSEKILRGVPKVSYGAFGGITPFPVCLKAVSDYLGDELDYSFAITASGGAFRFVWDTAAWNPGNVDIALTFKNPETVFRNGIRALGREFKMLWRAGIDWQPGTGTKDDFKTFIMEQIDSGKPVISLGPIGPDEAGLITGYRDDGDTLLGWSVFQDREWKSFDEEGYYITNSWWDAGDLFGVMSFGNIVTPRFDTRRILVNAVAALHGRHEGSFAKGIAAYDCWKKALLGVSENDFSVTGTEIFDDNNIMMCQGDAADCLIDGRKNAHLFFLDLAEKNPKEPMYAAIAEQFKIVTAVISSGIYDTLGGHERGPEQIKALAQAENRELIAEYIEEIKMADEKALSLMKKLLETM